MPIYLLYFSFEDELLDFRIPEVECCCQCLDIAIKWQSILSASDVVAFAEIPTDDDCRRLCQRTVFLRGIYECFLQVNTFEDLVSSLSSTPIHHVLDQGAAYRYYVESFGKRTVQAEKLQMIQEVLKFAHHGDAKVSLLSPDVKYWIIADYGKGARKPVDQRRVYYCKEVAECTTKTDMVGKYDLKDRLYLGTTSMPSLISFIMCNMANVQRYHMVLDLFCGTGSILVSAAHFGAKCFGVELDARVLRGREGVNVFSNFEQYQLEQVELIKGDSGSPFFWRRARADFFDSIVCDPPYGDRAMSRKVDKGRLKKCIDYEVEFKNESIRKRVEADLPVDEEEVNEELRAHRNNPLIAPTEQYVTSSMITDLLYFAAQYLAVGGRLVCWLPTTELYTDDELPSHSCMSLLYNTQQSLTIKLKRRLLTYVKSSPFDGTPAIPPKQMVSIKNNTYESDLYKQYKEKVEQRKEASKTYLETGAVSPEAIEEKVRLKKSQQLQSAANRKRKLRERAQEHHAKISKSIHVVGESMDLGS